MKLRILLTAILAVLIFGNAAGQRKFVVVLDPGHGGDDPGAIYGKYQEKHLNLELALALGALIRREIEGVDVLYTRTDDRRVDLARRGNFANRSGADLFLSIHANANKSANPSGTETYVMGMDKSDENLEVIRRENEAMKFEENYAETYAGFDPSSTEMSIIFGMLQYAQFESSLKFARLIQKHFGKNLPLKDRGAKQGPFAVLWRPTMPRVLTEVGFVSNENDRSYIFSAKGKETIVQALFAAFREFKTTYESDANEAAVAVAAAPEVKPQPKPEPKPEAKPVTPVASKKEERKPAAGAIYHVQLAAARNRISVDDAQWGAYSGKVVERRIDGWWKYSIGPYTQSQADMALREARQGRFPQAFITK